MTTLKKLAFVASACLFAVCLNAQTELKLKLEKGKTYSAITKSEQTMNQSMNGMQMVIVINSTSSMSFTPTSLEDGFMNVDVKIDSMVTSVDMPGRKMITNSNKPGNPKNPEEVMSTVMNQVCQNIIKAKMSYTGKIIEFTNVKDIAASALKAFDSVPEPTKSQMKPMAEMMVSESTLKSSIETITAYFPQNTVKVGDKWEGKLTISAGGMTLLITNNYKLKAIDGNIATIAAEAAIEPGGNGKMNMNGMQLDFEIRGMGSNDLTIDTTTGWIVKAKGKQRMQGNISFSGNSMPLEIEGKSEVEGK